jgi:hypothetical protein
MILAGYQFPHGAAAAAAAAATVVACILVAHTS